MKEMADLIKKLGDIELNRKILTLETEVLDLTRDKRRVEEKVEELERTLKQRQTLYFFEPFYWLKEDTTPYCPSCWETKMTAVHVLFEYDTAVRSNWSCPSCKHKYEPERLRQDLVSAAALKR
ncbi:MAG: hypothetical protein LAN61_07755 [Acidobacteriia bacterium]|nr:hypothetical protein [Terriglobia bacterium]